MGGPRVTGRHSLPKWRRDRVNAATQEEHHTDQRRRETELKEGMK
jgi:hypothetical protein